MLDLNLQSQCVRIARIHACSVTGFSKSGVAVG